MKENKGMLWGTILIIVGLGLLLQNVFQWFRFDYAWPLIIVAVGIYLLKKRK